MEDTSRLSDSPAMLVAAFVAIAIALLMVLGAMAGGALDAPEVALGDHAVLRHGQEAEEVRAHFMALAEQQGEAFWSRPPCRDGRYRWVDRMSDGRWGVWALDKVGSLEYSERTAFKCDQNQARKIMEDCGIDSWTGHAYGGG